MELVHTRTLIFLIDDPSEKGCSIFTPGGSFVSNIVCANLSISISSISHNFSVSMPSSLILPITKQYKSKSQSAYTSASMSFIFCLLVRTRVYSLKQISRELYLSIMQPYCPYSQSSHPSIFSSLDSLLCKTMFVNIVCFSIQVYNLDNKI